MNLNSIVQLLVSGIAMGCVYAMIGIEFTLIFNATGLINFAHDRLVNVAAYIFGGSFMVGLNLWAPMSILMTLIIMGFMGVLIALCVFNPLKNMRSDIYAVLGTLLLARIWAELLRIFWGPSNFTVPGWLSGTFKFGSIIVTKSNIIICIVSVITVVCLVIFMNWTKPGKAMRCVAQNKKAAALMGINVNQSIAVTTAVSLIICAIIGILIIPLFNCSLTMAGTIGMKGFCASVVGGFGYLPGNIVGGIFIGILENLSILVIPSVYKDIISFAVMIIFLIVKPSGFLGKRA